MARNTGLLLLLFVFGSCISSEAQIPVFKGPAGKMAGNITVSIDSLQQLYIGSNKIDSKLVDSLLSQEINKMKSSPYDTITVVINADTAALYGTVYHIMRVAKKQGAKVVATVK